MIWGKIKSTRIKLNITISPNKMDKECLKNQQFAEKVTIKKGLFE
jgi:hypothetical protein